MAFNRPIPESKEPRKYGSGLATLIEAEKMMQIAILLPSGAFIGWLLGAWGDSLLHQKWMATAGIIFGGVSGLVYVVRLVVNTKTKPTNPTPAEPEDSKQENEQ
jgi:F0F1-type ATP synthase assembly protein I